MNEFKVSFDNQTFLSKPSADNARLISNRIGRSVKKFGSANIRAFALDVSLDGHTFCPATFKDGKRNKENFEQQQLFALDFDGGISFEEVKKRADHYDLPILFAYETLSSKDRDKYRVVLMNDVPITDRKVAETMSMGLGTIFPEADSSCYKDVSKMYYGGKSVLHLYDKDDGIPKINIESLFRNLTNCLEDRHGVTNLRRHTEKFSRETGLALNRKGKFDVAVVDDLSALLETEKVTEEAGAIQNDKNSPSSIIYPLYIIGDGEKLSYVMNFGSTSEPSVAKRNSGSHADFRSSDLDSLGARCRLFREFETGERKLSHLELFGIATCMIQVESGSVRFMEILRATSRYAQRPDKYRKWEQDLRRIKGYKPYFCNRFCPYKDECPHGANMLSRPKRGKMERLSGYVEDFAPLEDVQEDVYRIINKAYRANDVMRHIIKAMTGSGKTTAYKRIMSENPTDSFAIAAPTNILKNQVYNDAVEMGLNVMKTPSLEEIKDEMPAKVWNTIISFYQNGRHGSVHPFIYETLKKKDIPCLREYMEAREKLKTFDGSIITTHRYLLNMDIKRLRRYDAVIIDEDIILKSVISNQCNITISDLKALSEATSDSQLSKRIEKLLELAETKSCIELDGFEWDDGEEEDADGISTPFDIPSFCLAEKFYIRRAATEKNLKEDTVAFIKPVFFKDIKYIMVSATVDEKVCHYFFGEDNVNFYECKKAKYKGKLLQYPGKSMSRTSIDNAPGIIPRISKRFGIKEEYVITHKGYGDGSLWFGNTEGCNFMEGEDILVIGTPYKAEFVYKLAAFTMGLPFDEDAEMKDQLVTRNGHRFWFNTYEDEVLRAIHFWMIESELEQAVGRARLLRNDCDVHLFSNFPLSQTEIKEINYDNEVTE